MLKLSLQIMSSFFIFIFTGHYSLCLAAPPDAGSILNQQQQTEQSLPQTIPQEEDEDAQEISVSDTDVTVPVKRFSFNGFEGLAEEAELQEIADDSIGKELSFEELQQVVSRITDYLKTEKGYLLARAYLPQQDVTEGVIEIAVIAGRIEGNAVIDIAGDSRIKPDILEGIAARAVPADEALRLARVERAVLLINDLPGLSAKATIEQGDTSGTSRLIINASEGKIINTAVNVDNYGDRYTGAYRAAVQSSLNDPFGLGDQVILTLNKAKDLNQARLGYTLPIGTTGLTGSAYYSYLDYEIGKELEDLEAEGKARTMAVALNYPVIRTRKASLWVSLEIDRLNLEDEALGVKTSDRKLLVEKAGLRSSLYDGFGGGGMTISSLYLSFGDTDLSGSEKGEAYDKTGLKTAGSFWRATYTIARLQRINSKTSFFISARGQFSNDNLDSSQKFILGGPTGVRAYPVGEGSGDKGHMLTAEVRYDVSRWKSLFNNQLVGFVDTGTVKLHNNTWSGSVTNATGSNSYSLSGWGVGVNLSKSDELSVRMSYAHAMGGNNGRNQDGTNADNQDDKGRFWLQAVIRF